MVFEYTWDFKLTAPLRICEHYIDANAHGRSI